MPRTLTFPAPPAPTSDVPSLAALARIAEETDLADGVRVAGELIGVPGRRALATNALAGVLHARYFRGQTLPVPGGPGRRGDAFCRRLADAFRPEFFRGDGWRFAYRTSAGVPSFVVSTGLPDGDAASCFLHLQPGTAPEAFARLVGALHGYGLAFRAELAGDPADCLRADTAVVTVDRDDAAALARLALRVHARTPFVLAASVPAFTRRLAPGVALADEPGPGTPFGRHRCGLVAAGLLAAGRGAGPAERHAAVVGTLTEAGIDPAAVHLNPGGREVDLRR